MARLNTNFDSDEELPDLCTLLRQLGRSGNISLGKTATEKTPQDGNATTNSQTVDEDYVGAPPLKKTCSDQNEKPDVQTSQTEKSPRKQQRKLPQRKLPQRKLPQRKLPQRKLGLAPVNSLLLRPVANNGGVIPEEDGWDFSDRDGFAGVRGLRSPMKKEFGSRLAHVSRAASSSSSSCSSDESVDESTDDMADFIVSDSVSECEELSGRVSKVRKLKARKDGGCGVEGRVGGFVPKGNRIGVKSPAKSRFGLPGGEIWGMRILDKSLEVAGGDFHDELETGLKFSPPEQRGRLMLHSPTTGEHTITPPPSPTKVHLPSPSKKPRIPPSPHRPSVDAFWSHEIINEWNDRHSPTREPSFQREKKKNCSFDDDDKSSKTHSSIPLQSPPLSPRKQPTTTKKKKEDQPEVQRRKKFNAEKHELASSFLQEIDQTITDGKITSLTSSTGGIRIVWSNKLQSTAGRAHWKGDAISVVETGDGGTRLEKKEYRHHATIELAEKVIDDEDRLLNVLAHEYCHLATIMISGKRDNPHGKEFKSWAHLLTTKFSHRSIHVTTKHTSEISYKYIWTCTSATCRYEHKRHSKSIDPKRHACGKCKSPLVQVKPTPRVVKEDGISRTEEEDTVAGGMSGVGGMGGMEGGRKRTAWQEYVKLHLGEVREKNKGLGMKGWMEEVGRGFREEKGGKKMGGEETRAEGKADGKGDEDEGGLMRFEGLRLNDGDDGGGL